VAVANSEGIRDDATRVRGEQMAEGGDEKASSSTPTVFISYASQDAEAAQHVCQALRAAGIEVWFDQSELRGGDVWDRSIRRQIKTCALFLPVISRHTHARDEGYFRLEWKLAVDRSHLMTGNKAFLLPIVIDDTRDDDENVPDRFREVQWTRLSAGETPPAFVERVQRLLSPQPSSTASSPATSAAPHSRIPSGPLGASRRSKAVLLGVVAVLAVASAYLLLERPWISKHPAANPVTATAAAASAPANAAPFVPPPHSIAVLPFVNMSGDKEQDYFSDGLTEELLNSLAEISELQVAARTSAFSFKGKDTDIGTIARKLNVGAVLEGSVRRSSHTVRITAQLINAVTGFHLWSKTYDRDLGDVLKLQTQIATAVAGALKVTLLADTATKIELGGTRNAAAFDAYLRATRASDAGGGENYLSAVAAFTDAIRLDPNFALAFAGRSFVETLYAAQDAPRPAVRQYFDKALTDAHQALTLAPDLAEGHVALGFYLANGALDLTQARAAFERARALAPGRATILRISGLFVIMTGSTEAGVADLRRAVTLDPLSALTRHLLGFGLYLAHRYEESRAASAEAISLDPDLQRAYEYSCLTDYQLGNFAGARVTAEARPNGWGTQWCLALTYQKLGRHADAQAAVARIQALQADTAAYQYSTIYAQWGDIAKALDWLESAMRLRDPGLSLLRTDPLMDPLRKESRYQAVERQLKFPN
jgi:TolB-like protein/Tfp pilus assembly protein PilF